ncbi:DUF11 domain-containing protein, partial [Algoriphagus kandeliae]
AEQNADIVIDITDNEADITEEGEEITYTITVTNTGNVTLENVTIVDSQTGLVVNVGTLKPGESKSVDTTYPVDQDDVDTGSVTNEATATGESPSAGDDDPTDTDEVTTLITPLPSIEMVKTADKETVSEVGEVVTYTLTVTNTGNVTKTDVTVSDPLTGYTEVIETLAPGESVVLTTEYVVTQQDLDNGEIINVATVKATTPDDTEVEDEDSESVIAEQNASIEIVKTADREDIQGIGEEVVYTLTVTNTGNVTLTDVTVTDPLTGLDVALGTLSPGETKSVETTYTVAAGDLENGITNVAVVTATTPDDEQIGDEDSITIGVSPREIIANDDDFGTYFVSYGGRLGNILDNDLLEGQRPDPDDVDFEFTE